MEMSNTVKMQGPENSFIKKMKLHIAIKYCQQCNFSDSLVPAYKLLLRLIKKEPNQAIEKPEFFCVLFISLAY